MLVAATPSRGVPQSVAREARAEAGGARADLAAASAAGLRQLEGWARGEMLAVTGKLKHVVASCAAQQEQVRPNGACITKVDAPQPLGLRPCIDA
jgi:hypothetical protein